jgi:hypothetical protein
MGNKEVGTKMFCYDPAWAVDWDITGKECAHAYNTSVHYATGYTPFYLVHGYHPRSLNTLYWHSTNPPIPSSGTPVQVAEFQRHHHECLRQAYEHLAQDARKRAACTPAPPDKQPHFNIGELVRVATRFLPIDNDDTKFRPRFLEPFKVLDHRSPQTYKLGFGEKYPGLSPYLNITDLRPYILTLLHLPTPTTGRSAAYGRHQRPTCWAIIAQARARGRPTKDGRFGLQFQVKFQNLDSHYNVWLSEKRLREYYPDKADSLIAKFNANKPGLAGGQAYLEG